MFNWLLMVYVMMVNMHTVFYYYIYSVFSKPIIYKTLQVQLISANHQINKYILNVLVLLHLFTIP